MQLSRVRIPALPVLGLSLALLLSACGGSEDSAARGDTAPGEVSVEESDGGVRPDPNAAPDADEAAADQAASAGDEAAEQAPATVSEAVLRMAIRDATTSGLHPQFEV